MTRFDYCQGRDFSFIWVYLIIYSQDVSKAGVSWPLLNLS